MLHKLTSSIARLAGPFKARLGATGMAYSLMVGLVAIVALVAIEETGETLSTDLLGEVGSTMADAAGNAPIASGIFENGYQDEPFILSASLFEVNFSEPLKTVRIKSLPDFATLTVGGVPVTRNQELTPEQLDQMVLTPDPGFDGQGVFDWQGTSDGEIWSRTALVNVFFNVVEVVHQLNPILDQVMVENSTIVVPVEIVTEGDADLLTLIANSDDQSLFRDSGLQFGGIGTSRNITLTPESNQTGTAVITIEFDEPGQAAVVAFNVTVTPADRETEVSFTDITGAEPGEFRDSEIVTLANDFDGPIDAVIVGNGATMRINGGGEVSTGQVSPGDTLQLRMMSSASFLTPVSTSLTLGNSDAVSWSITTRGNDQSPAGSGAPGSDLDVAPSSSQTSDVVTLGDFDGSLSISATNGAIVEVDSGSGFAPASTAQAGDQVRLVMTANSGLNSTSNSTFTIGDYTSATYTVRTWYYTTGSATGYGSCSGACSSTGTRSPTGWTCNRSDGTSGHSQSNCGSPGNQSCSTDSCFTSTTPTTDGVGTTDPTVTFGNSQTIRITCSADGGIKNAVDSITVNTSQSSASIHMSQIRTPTTGRIGQAIIYFSVSGGNVYATSMSTGFNGKQHMCYSPSQGNCSQIPDYNCSSPIACRAWNLNTGQRWYFVRSGSNRGQSYVSGSDNIIQATCIPGHWPSSTFRYCWQNGSC